MLKKYKNELLDVVKKNRFPVSDFDASEHDAIKVGKTFNLVHKPSDFHFVVWNDPGNYDLFGGLYTNFVPGLTDFYFPEYSNYDGPGYCNVMELVVHCMNWLDGIFKYNEDLATPDLWANISSIMDNPNINYQSDEESLNIFTAAEKESIVLAIGELKLLIKQTFPMNAEQSAFLNKKLDYLIKGVDRLNKFDWNGLALNVIMNISTALLLNSENQRVLAALFKTVFSNIIRLLN